MYLEHIASQYSLSLTPEQTSLVGLIGLIAMAAIVIFDVAKKLKPPKKRVDSGSSGLSRCERGFYYALTGSLNCSKDHR